MSSDIALELAIAKITEIAPVRIAINFGVAYFRDDFASFVGWASYHWCQVKADAQMSSDLAAL
ncbi:hypothetical protein, partial [Nostoc sp. CALU 1950]|uniref:hypothetical protein n=1 Tax=Nostoc sp. CALU 1950 TaxID=3104321 RepID=UPI003EB7C1D7